MNANPSGLAFSYWGERQLDRIEAFAGILGLTPMLKERAIMVAYHSAWVWRASELMPVLSARRVDAVDYNPWSG